MKAMTPCGDYHYTAVKNGPITTFRVFSVYSDESASLTLCDDTEHAFTGPVMNVVSYHEFKDMRPRDVAIWLRETQLEG